MFTGIVEATGEIRATERDEGGYRLKLESQFDDLSTGQSISVSGACLTVEDYGEDWFAVFLSEETVARTYLTDLSVGDVVNLELALSADGRFDGHVVQGHVDGTATVREVNDIGDDWEFVFSLPSELLPYVVEKGSIAVDGISLTVANLTDDSFSTAIIPESYRLTNLSSKSPGDPVHLEVDVLAKYVESVTEAYR